MKNRDHDSTSKPSSPETRIEERVTLDDVGMNPAMGFVRILFGLGCIALGFAAYFCAGHFLDLWSPALGLAVLGACAYLGKRLWDLDRYLISSLAAGLGTIAAALLGSTEGLGIQVVAVATVIASLALFSPYLPGNFD